MWLVLLLHGLSPPVFQWQPVSPGVRTQAVCGVSPRARLGRRKSWRPQRRCPGGQHRARVPFSLLPAPPRPAALPVCPSPAASCGAAAGHSQVPTQETTSYLFCPCISARSSTQHIHVHACAHACIHTCMYRRTHTLTHRCTCAYTHAHTHVHVHRHAHHTRTFAHTQTHARKCAHTHAPHSEIYSFVWSIVFGP